MKILITGSSGFVGSRLAASFSKKGSEVVGVDVLSNSNSIETVIGDLRSPSIALQRRLSRDWDVIVHCATELDFSSNFSDEIEVNNVEMTRNVIGLAMQSSRSSLVIFLSSASIFLGRSELWEIPQDALPHPTDAYGRSKVKSEELIRNSGLDYLIIRCPMIVDEGRVGMISIPFELIKEGARVWTLGSGGVKHQMLSLRDLSAFIELSIARRQTGIVNLGAKEADSLSEIYAELISKAGSSSKIGILPKRPALFLLTILRKMGLSPLGPYQFRMLTTNFKFSSEGVKENFAFSPSDSNKAVVVRAFSSWNSKGMSRQRNIRLARSGNQSSINWGLLRFLKLLKF